MVIGTLIKLLRLASLASCLIAVAWFVTFAVHQSSTAAAHQASEIYATPPSQTQPASQGQESGLKKMVNSAFKTLSSPFSGVLSGASSQWEIHIVETLIALLIYGLGLGFLARMLRMAG